MYELNGTPPESSAAPRRLALIRHGETAWNAEHRFQGHVDNPLNEAGWEQASAAAKSLPKGPWDAVLVSPLMRAQQTAAAVITGARLGAPILIPGLIERTFGEAEGLRMDEAREQWPADDFPGSESLAQVAARVSDAWNEIQSHFPHGDLVIVVHVVIIRELSLLLTGEDPGFVPNGSVTLLDSDAAGRWSLSAPVASG